MMKDSIGIDISKDHLDVHCLGDGRAARQPGSSPIWPTDWPWSAGNLPWSSGLPAHLLLSEQPFYDPDALAKAALQVSALPAGWLRRHVLRAITFGEVGT